MRWFWRADPPTILLDGLLEGSLIGVAYIAAAMAGGHPAVILPLPVFWLAAAAGLAAARLPRGVLREVLSVPVLALALGGLGWIAHPDVSLGSRDLFAALSTHPAGWLLGVAVLRGAVHSNTAMESDICTTAMAVSIPLLGLSLGIHVVGGRGLVVVALVGTAVCLVSGMLALSLARVRELESTVTAVRTGTKAWRQIAAGIVALGLLCIAVALVVGTVTQEPLLVAGRWAVDTARWIAEQVFLAVTGWLASVLGPPGPVTNPLPTARPSAAAGPQGAPVTPGLGAFSFAADVLVRIALLIVAAVAFLWLQRYARRWRLRSRRHDGLPVPEERMRTSGAAAGLRRLLPAVRIPLPFRRRAPTTAAEAYLATLEQLSEREDLGRRPDETPRQHTRRIAATTPLEPRPLALLAADYQLAVYARASITDRETARAIGRWQRLRRLARRLPPDADARVH